MRRLLVLTAVAVSAWLTLTQDASAFKRCRRCCCVCPPPACAAATPATPNTLTSAKGKTYRFYDSDELPLFRDEVRTESRSNRLRLFAFESRRLTTGDDFNGHDRGQAKTTWVDAPVEGFNDLGDLLQTLPSDDHMRHYNPRITRTWDSPRVAEERRNVTVTAYLYASKKEDDNDYHLILGRTETETAGTYMMTAEITGLPDGEPYRSTLTTPRNDFKAFFNGRPPGTSYRVFEDRIHVRVTGTLFYDIDHAPGIVGTGDYKPETAWEIHPVTTIEFLD